MYWKILWLIAFSGLVYSRYFIVGPAKIRVLSIIPCKNYSNLPMQFNFKSRMFNESTQFLTADWYIPMDLDENVTMTVKCSRIDTRKTQVNSFVINEAEACSSMLKYAGDLWLYIQKEIGMEPGVCPVKMGNYSVQNMVLDLTRLNVQMLLEGRFKSRVLVKHLSKLLYCGDFTFELSPKKS